MNQRRSFSAEEARNLLRRARTGTLATLNVAGGTPYASLVNLATDVAGHPLILVSTLAWHTRNLLADPRPATRRPNSMPVSATSPSGRWSRNGPMPWPASAGSRRFRQMRCSPQPMR